MIQRLFQEKKRDTIVSVPNIITSVGMVTVGFYALTFNFFFLFLAGLSDILDGFFARLLNQKTFLGSILDPVRDRALMLVMLYHLWLISGAWRVVLIVILIETTIFIFWLVDVYQLKEISLGHIFGKVRQGGHLVFGGLGVLKLVSPFVALGGMIFFSALLLKFMAGRMVLRPAGKYLDSFQISNLLEKGGMNGL